MTKNRKTSVIKEEMTNMTNAFGFFLMTLMLSVADNVEKNNITANRIADSIGA